MRQVSHRAKQSGNQVDYRWGVPKNTRPEVALRMEEYFGSSLALRSAYDDREEFQVSVMSRKWMLGEMSGPV